MMKMPWEEDKDWNCTATTIVKGEPMGDYIFLDEIETKEDKICPLLSIGRLSQYSTLLKCVGEKCMWWNKCNGERRADDNME